MSMFHTETVTCPVCEATSEQTFATSVNADRRPDLRQDILDDRFQRLTCSACGAEFRFAPHLTYLNVDRGQWILTMAAPQRPFWESLEAGALEIYNDSFGPDAPNAARAIGERLTPRITFGWSGLREKLLCDDLGINDVELELLKVLLMRTVEASAVTTRAALRLLEADAAGDLRLAWRADDTEGADDILTVPRRLLDGIREQGAAWDALRAEISNGPFVDATKLFTPAELPVAAT
jgi:hypothetical protein